MALRTLLDGAPSAVALAACLAALLSACEVEADRDSDPSAADTTDTLDAGVASAYWTEEPPLTLEDLERGRLEDTWRLAASVQEFATGLADSVRAGVPTRVPADPIRIPESWDDTGAGPSVLTVQVLLDRTRFSPGVIDGRWGKNTEKAIYWLQRREGLPATGLVDSVTLGRLREVAEETGWAAGSPRALTTRVLTDEDVSGPFVEISDSVYEHAELGCLCYASLREKLAERFHTTPEVLERLNPGAPLDSLATGDSLRVPDVEPMRQEPPAREAAAAGTDSVPAYTQATDSVPADTAEPRAPATSVSAIARIVVSDRGRYLHALDREGRILYHFPSTLGSRYSPSPTGRLEVATISRWPWFHYQPHLLEGVPDEEPPTRLPPGPNSPVGLVWIELTRENYGIHGTAEPAAIGYTTSSGCVRLTNWDAVVLADLLATGVPVEFIDLADDAPTAMVGPSRRGGFTRGG